MPVIIKELYVKVNVEEEKRDRPERFSRPDRVDQDAVINACVEKVVEIINRENIR